MARKSVLIIIAMLIMLLLPAGRVLAIEAEDTPPPNADTGDSGSSDIVKLSSSSVSNGDTNVPINPTIQLDFDKNIAALSVQARNSESIHLTDESESPVAIRVIFPDEQLQQTFKSQIFIIPKESLEPKTLYTLTIDNTLQAKNGNMIDDAHSIQFMTGEGKTEETNAILAELGEDILEYETQQPLTGASVPARTNTPEGPTDGEAFVKNYSRTSSLATIVLVAVVTLFLFFAALLVIKRRGK